LRRAAALHAKIPQLVEEKQQPMRKSRKSAAEETGQKSGRPGQATFEEFFRRASLHPNAHLTTGVVCGYRVEEVENPLTRKARYLDKLIDELAKGRKMEKVLRT
jgi:hypothetical protein